MARPRFLADHDLNEHIVDAVLRREPEAEFVRARDLGLDQAADEEVLGHAAEHGFLVVSHDVNTMSAAAAERVRSGEPMAGLVLVAQSVPLRETIDDLCMIWGASDAAEWQNRIEYLPI